MIKLTWGNLRDTEFMRSLGKLFGQPMSYDYGCRFTLLGREIKKQQKLCDETHLGILKKYGTPDKEKTGVYQLHDATREEYAEEMKKLDDHEFTVRVQKFDGQALSEIVKMSPQDLMLIEGILLPIDEESQNPPPLKAVDQASDSATH